MSSEWDDIDGVEGWRAKLESILEEAQQLPDNAPVTALRRMNRRLTEYQLHSGPDSNEIARLDAIAEQAREGMMKTAIEDRLDRLASSSAELARFTKQIRDQADSLRQTARELRLERIEKAVDSLTGAIRSIRDLIEAADDASEEELIRKAERIITTLQNFRNEIER